MKGKSKKIHDPVPGEMEGGHSVSQHDPIPVSSFSQRGGGFSMEG